MTKDDDEELNGDPQWTEHEKEAQLRISEMQVNGATNANIQWLVVKFMREAVLRSEGKLTDRNGLESRPEELGEMEERKLVPPRGELQLLRELWSHAPSAPNEVYEGVNDIVCVLQDQLEESRNESVELLAADVWAYCFDRGDFTGAQANKLMAELFPKEVVEAARVIIQLRIGRSG